MDAMSLIERLESAKEGSRDLSCQIARAAGWELRENIKNDFKWLGPDGQAYLIPPDFSRDVDAALSLLPKGWFGEVTFGGRSFQLAWVQAENWADKITGRGATSALALCIAVLRAIEALKSGPLPAPVGA